MAIYGTLGENNIGSVSASISDTAVDVFVYDTSKDSDGGAWRKRTQHTSWYNETLNTSTRGSRKEFPAVAVIVAEATQLTIYDGDDPDLPMWMVFNLSGAVGAACNMLTRGGGGQESDITSIACLNAKLVVGLKDVDGTVGEGPVEVNFISDFGRVYREVGSGYTAAIYNLPISGRNSNSAYSGDYNSLGIVAQTINDVAMTVLPNAPIDDATGLPVPTIAVATDGGVSVIKDDGTVVDIYRTSDDDVHYVSLDGDRVIMFMELGAIYVATIPSADQSGNPNAAWSVYGSFSDNTSGTDHPAIQAYAAGVDLVSMKDHTFATAGFNGSSDQYKGLSILSEDINSSGNGMVAWAHTDFNTGWMHGDIKGAFLSDTDTTNTTATSSASNIVQNGDFGTGDFTNWTTAGTTTPTISAGGALLTTGAIDGTIHQVISNAPYGALIEWTITSNSAGEFGLLINGTSASSTGSEVTTFTASGSYDYTGPLTGVAFRHRVTGNGVIDNIVVRPYTEADRSVNAKGLRTYGTITKSAVATGADLVAYSGWSTSNYLEQPPNTDMNVGTGDFYVMGWAYPTNNTNGYIWEYGETLNTSGYTEVFYHDSGQFRFYINGIGNVQGNVTSNNWNHFVAMRSGGVMYMYINGKLTNQTTNTTSLSNTSAKMRIGIRAYDISAPFYGKIALVRMGASAPSPEQIKKIYEDEKVLFQENAKCTLYGSSDAVTALAYDDSTNLLYAGTSSGRSDFQGLRRINNTTTAVTTAMSASNGLVAEQ